MNILANDAVRLFCRVRDIAGYLRVMMGDALGAKTEGSGIRIAGLKLEAGPVDGAAIEARWSASLKPAAAGRVASGLRPGGPQPVHPNVPQDIAARRSGSDR